MEELGCFWCEKREFDGLTVILPCGFEICKKHLDVDNQYEDLICSICEDHVIDVNECFNMKRNKDKLKRFEFNQKLKDLDPALNRFEEIKKDPQFHLEENYQDIQNKLDLRREEIKIEIDKFYDKLMEKISTDKQNTLQKVHQVLYKLDNISQTKEILSKSKLFELDKSSKEIEDIKKQLDNFNQILNKPLSYDLLAPNKEFELENIFGNLDLKQEAPSNKPSYSTSFEGIIIKKFKGHRSWVRCVKQLGPDTIISGSSDTTLKIWDLENDACIKTLFGHKNYVTGIEIIDESLVLSSSCDTSIKMWHLPTCRSTKTFRGHESGVWCIKLLANNIFASGSNDSSIKIWDLHSGRCIRTLYGHEGSVNCLLNLKNEQIASGSSDKSIKIWNPMNGMCISTFFGHLLDVMCLDLTLSGNLISGSKDHTIKIWDLSNGYCLNTLVGHVGSVLSLHVCENGHEILSASNDFSIIIWNLDQDEYKLNINMNNPIQCVTQLQNGRILSCSNDRTIYVLE